MMKMCLQGLEMKKKRLELHYIFKGIMCTILESDLVHSTDSYSTVSHLGTPFYHSGLALEDSNERIKLSDPMQYLSS